VLLARIVEGLGWRVTTTSDVGGGRERYQATTRHAVRVFPVDGQCIYAQFSVKGLAVIQVLTRRFLNTYDFCIAQYERSSWELYPLVRGFLQKTFLAVFKPLGTRRSPYGHIHCIFRTCRIETREKQSYTDSNR
jgi:hypothetical protein